MDDHMERCMMNRVRAQSHLDSSKFRLIQRPSNRNCSMQQNSWRNWNKARIDRELREIVDAQLEMADQNEEEEKKEAEHFPEVENDEVEDITSDEVDDLKNDEVEHLTNDEVDEAKNDESKKDDSSTGKPDWKLLENKRGQKWLWCQRSGYCKNVDDPDSLAVPPEEYPSWHRADKLAGLKAQLKILWADKKELQTKILNTEYDGEEAQDGPGAARWPAACNSVNDLVSPPRLTEADFLHITSSECPTAPCWRSLFFVDL